MADEAQAAFVQAASRDGIELESRTFDWLSEQGHVGLERVAMQRRDGALREPVTAAVAVLGAIYAQLKGDLSVLQAARENLLLGVDLVHPPTGTVVELDGPEHFTSFRLTALELYPADAVLGFDRAEHEQLCRACCEESDGLSRGLAAKGFGFGGVPREQAYNDALLDLGAVAMGLPAPVRVAAVEGDGEAAYDRCRDGLRAFAS